MAWVQLHLVVPLMHIFCALHCLCAFLLVGVSSCCCVLNLQCPARPLHSI